MDNLNNEKQKKPAFNLLRFIILLVAAIVISLGLLLLLYNNPFTIEFISNILFVVGIVTFFPSLIAVTGAIQVTHGLRYVLRNLFDWNYRKEVKNFNEYKARKELKKENKSTVYIELLIIGIIFIIAGIIVSGYM